MKLYSHGELCSITFLRLRSLYRPLFSMLREEKKNKVMPKHSVLPFLILTMFMETACVLVVVRAGLLLCLLGGLALGLWVYHTPARRSPSLLSRWSNEVLPCRMVVRIKG